MSNGGLIAPKTSTFDVKFDGDIHEITLETPHQPPETDADSPVSANESSSPKKKSVTVVRETLSIVTWRTAATVHSLRGTIHS